MAQVNIAELATEGISLSDFFAKANTAGVASKNTIQNLMTLFETVGEVGFKGSISAGTYATHPAGWYFATNTGDYIMGATTIPVDVSDTLTIIIVDATIDNSSKVEVPLTITIDAVPTNGSTNLLQSGGAKTYIDAVDALKADISYVDSLPSSAFLSNDVDDYIYPILDSENRFLGGYTNDGTFVTAKSIEKNERVAEDLLLQGQIDALEIVDDDLQSQITDIDTRSLQLNDVDDYIYPIVDVDNRFLGGYTNDGTFVPAKIRLPINSVAFTNLDEKLQTFSESDGKLTVLCSGDSMTQGAGEPTVYPDVLQTLLGSNYNVINAGVGGETPATIAARHGGVSAIINTAFTLPASSASTVEISSFASIRLKSELFNKNVLPLKQGSTLVNPCYIQGIECTLSYNPTGEVYSLKRNVTSADSTVITANSVLTFNGATLKKPYIQVIWIGTNGDYSTNADLILYAKKMIEFHNTKNFLVLGITTDNLAGRAALESDMRKEFGNKFFNARDYLVNYAMSDAGLTPTVSDLGWIADGAVPPSLRKPADITHLNSIGNEVLANKIYQIFQQLNYI